MSAAESTPSASNQNSKFMMTSTSNRQCTSSGIFYQKQSMSGPKYAERIGRGSSRSFAFPASLKNLKADLMASSTPNASQILTSDAGEGPISIPPNSLGLEEQFQSTEVQSPRELHRQQQDDQEESQQNLSGPLHRQNKQHRSISPSTPHKKDHHQSPLSLFQNRFPPLWTEGFAKDVTSSVKRAVDDSVLRGSLVHAPTRRVWSSLLPEDIILRPSFGELSSEDVEDEYILGSGSFSKVMKVQIKGKEANSSHSLVALKRLKGDLLPTKLTENSCKNGSVAAFTKAATELAREAFLLSRFDHPHVINILGWTDGGVTSYSTYRRHDAYFLVLELLQEETLEDRIEGWNQDDDYLQSNPCGENDRKAYAHQRKMEQLTICRQVASALSYIHSKNVVYRDLKPQNIGFARGTNISGDDYGENVFVKLMDFGLARELPSSGAIQSYTAFQEHLSNPMLFDMTGTVGTIRYMAPEVCMNRPYGLECDIYSWSIVAHEIFSQVKPFDDMTPDMYQSLVCQRGVRPPTQNMPSEHIILLTQAWRTDPSKRLPFNRIKRQLDLFLQQEKLIWEAQGLLEGAPEKSESEILLSKSFTQNDFGIIDSSSQRDHRRSNKRTWDYVDHEDCHRRRVPNEKPIYLNVSMDYHGEHDPSVQYDNSPHYHYSHNKTRRKSPVFEESPPQYRRYETTTLSPPRRRPEPVTPDQRHHRSHRRSHYHRYNNDHNSSNNKGDGYHTHHDNYNHFGSHRQVSPSNDHGYWEENFH